MRVIKPAILAYPNSNNLGDDIQSIAAKQWIPFDEIMGLDRDHLNAYSGPQVKLVMNGWFMEAPSNWPPSKKITPLFLSFHLNPSAQHEMLNHEGVAYLKEHQPIGCRDKHTQKVLEQNGIKTYFSACLTLGLNRTSFVAPKTKRSGILLISPMERLLPEPQTFRLTKTKGLFNILTQAIKFPYRYLQYKKAMGRLHVFLEQKNETVIWHSQLIDRNTHTEKARIIAAENQLKLIATARLVITSRIHSALPAVAFNTPVLFLSDGLDHKNQQSRLEGMEAFFPIINSNELAAWKIKQPKPSDAHLPFINKFKEETSRFFKE
ncbi:MAG: hypothetical protein ACI9TK_000051 [Flavobacteriaceae bacterium]|jgi:hypothetical protein|tara:strand:+ start:145 stop:1107 length:963 start_codon:yes stop_codon:yes gene_type:complete